MYNEEVAALTFVELVQAVLSALFALRCPALASCRHDAQRTYARTYVRTSCDH